MIPKGNVKVAVVGCGSIGSRHLAVLSVEPGAEIVAICDINAEAGSKFSALYGGVPFFTDLSDMLRRSDAEVVDICTPHSLHATMAMAAASAGKHVLVEKPMALTTREAVEMIVTARKSNVRLMVVKQNRYNVPIVLTKKVLDSGRLGRVLMVQCNVLWNRHDEYYSKSPWRGRKTEEGGALFTQVSHFIDLLIWWFGDVVRASSQIATRNHQIEIEDCGIAALSFSTGVMGSLFWTTCVYRKNYEGSITIIGEKGIIKIGGEYLNRIEHWDIQDFPLPDGIRFEDQPNSYGKYQGTSSNHDKVISDLVTDLRTDRRTVVDGDVGFKTIKAIEMMYENCKILSLDEPMVSTPKEMLEFTHA